MQNNEEKVKEILSENLCIDIGSISNESFVVKDLGADSLTILSIFLDIAEIVGEDKSKKFEQNVNYKELKVCDIVRFINESDS